MFNRQLHVSNYDRLKDGCRGSSSTECQTINRMGGVRSGMPTDDAKIPASKVVENYDANGKVVSYTLIDSKTNQPTMIMEPLEFAAYRNATPGTQAMMQTSPQYALDFASAGLYSATGDNGRAIEHVTAGVTSRDYVRDVALGVAGAAGAAATAARPALGAMGGAELAKLEAQNIANASKLAEQLKMQSAKSPFTANGKLTPDATQGAEMIIKPGDLNNPNIPPGFGKYATETFQSPAGDFTMHFYKNPTNGEVFYGLAYKAVFNKMSGVSQKP